MKQHPGTYNCVHYRTRVIVGLFLHRCVAKSMAWGVGVVLLDVMITITRFQVFILCHDQLYCFFLAFFFLNPSHPPSLFLFHRHWLTGTCLPTKSWQLSWYSKPPIAPECTPHGKDLRRHFRQALELSLPARPWEGSGATMTIIYQYRVATTSLGGFLRLLTIWRGSVYKLMYKEILIFSSMYAAISVTYRVGLNEKQRQ